MPRKATGLTAAKVRTADPGRYGDGGGLYLLVRPGGGRFWLFRYVIAKKMREMGLGPASGRDAVMLTDARTAARKLWEAVRAGRDPLDDRKAEAEAKKAAALAAQALAVTFKDAAASYIVGSIIIEAMREDQALAGQVVALLKSKVKSARDKAAIADLLL
jgi:hypothetical protein